METVTIYTEEYFENMRAEIALGTFDWNNEKAITQLYPTSNVPSWLIDLFARSPYEEHQQRVIAHNRVTLDTLKFLTERSDVSRSIKRRAYETMILTPEQAAAYMKEGHIVKAHGLITIFKMRKARNSSGKEVWLKTLNSPNWVKEGTTEEFLAYELGKRFSVYTLSYEDIFRVQILKD